MSFQSNVTTALTRIATEFKAIRTLISGTATGDVSGLDTTASNIVDAINEVLASSGGSSVATLDDLTDVVITSPATGHVLRFNGTNFVNVTNPLDGVSLDTDTALAANSDTKVASQKATKAYVDALLAAANAMVFKGVVDASANPNYPAANAGDMYRISVAGKIGGASGVNVEVGDQVLCVTDGSSAGNQATVGANWNITQVNIDGAVVGAASSTAGDLATFSGTSGKVIQDSGVAISTDTSLTSNSDAKVPTEKAVKGYTYSQTQIGDPTHDFAADFTTALT